MRIQIPAAVLVVGLTQAAYANQIVIAPTSPVPLNPALIYEIDYATAGKFPTLSSGGTVDTIVSIGLPAKATALKCNVQVAWYDWNGAPAGVSGNASLSAGVTLEFTTSVNSTMTAEYVPFVENVFRDSSPVFEGYAQIRVDSGCANAKMRVDAEFVTHILPSGGSTLGESYTYKPINVTNVKGVTGY